MILGWLALAMAADGDDFSGPEPLPHADQATRFEVLDLDLDRGLVAWRLHVAGPHPCAYAGMEDPRAGVVLGVFHADDTADEHWAVYPPTHDAAGCLDHERSAARLSAAKARIAELGLSLDALPAGQEPEAAGLTLKSVVLTVEEPAGSDPAVVSRVRWKQATWEDRWSWSNKGAVERGAVADRVWTDGDRAFVLLAWTYAHHGGSGRIPSALFLTSEPEAP